MIVCLIPDPAFFPGRLRIWAGVYLLQLLPHSHAQDNRIGDVTGVQLLLQLDQGFLGLILRAGLERDEMDVGSSQKVHQVKDGFVPC